MWAGRTLLRKRKKRDLTVETDMTALTLYFVALLIIAYSDEDDDEHNA